MTESIHAYVLERLEAAGRQGWPEVAQGAGLSLRTVEKIARREIRYPRVDKVEALARYFRHRESSQQPQIKRRRAG